MINNVRLFVFTVSTHISHPISIQFKFKISYKKSYKTSHSKYLAMLHITLQHIYFRTNKLDNDRSTNLVKIYQKKGQKKWK